MSLFKSFQEVNLLPIFFGGSCLSGIVIVTVSQLIYQVRKAVGEKLSDETPVVGDETLALSKGPYRIFEKERLGLPLSHQDRQFLNSYRTANTPYDISSTPRAQISHREIPTKSQKGIIERKVSKDTSAARDVAQKSKKYKRTRRGKRAGSSKTQKRLKAQYFLDMAKSQAENYEVSVIHSDQGDHQFASFNADIGLDSEETATNLPSGRLHPLKRWGFGYEDDEMEDDYFPY